jgi:hypothetical protein
MVQELMSTCEGAMTTINCVNTEGDEHDTATAAFDEAASSLEELGFVHEVTLDGVVFSRSEPDAGKYDPGTEIGAAPFLGLSGAVELGSLDQVIGAAAYKGFNRCPVLVCPNAQVDGVKMGMCATKLQWLQLRLLSCSGCNLASQRLVEYTGALEGPGRCPSGPREQKKGKRNSQWHHQTPLLTEK